MTLRILFIVVLVMCSGLVMAQENPEETGQTEEYPLTEETTDSTFEESSTASNEGGFLEDAFSEEKFTFHGFIQLQSGIFVAPDEEVLDVNGYQIDHGGKLGQMSMFRGTLQLEADWRPTDSVWLHAVFRGTRALKVKADKDAQQPEPKKLITYKDKDFNTVQEWVMKSADENMEWVRDKYYNEFDLRELFIDIQASELLSIRLGRQQVAWGETGQFRLLDVINPIDSTWHFSSLESFESQRIPLWMANVTLEIPELQGNLQVVWIPMLDNSEDLVTVPLTFVGAWGLPTPVMGDGSPVQMAKYRRKVFIWPENSIENSRAGARWRGEIGNFTYSLVYFYTHVISPPIPELTYTPFASGGDLEIWLDFPRQHIVGASMETTIPNPVTLNVKFEAAFEPDRTYPVSSQKPMLVPTGVDGLDATTGMATRNGVYYDYGLLMNKYDRVARFDNPKKKVLSYALTLQRPLQFNWLNPEQSVMLVLQFMHTAILDFDSSDMAVEIPGYDTTVLQPHSFKLIGAIFTSYLHGMLSPKIVGVWAFARDPSGELVDQGGLLSASLGMAFGDHWRLNLALNEFFQGHSKYDGLGLFADRDEVNLSVRFQF